jgi:hypothetical protein
LFALVVEVTMPKLDQVPALPEVDLAKKMADFWEPKLDAE